MGFIAKNSGGGDYKRVPTGSHIARCYSIVDVGTQTRTGQFGTKSQREIQLGFEVFCTDDNDCLITVDVEGVLMPLTIRKSYTLSLNEKARLRKELAGWRGRDFTDAEAAGFDVSKLLGVFCMLNITESVQGDKTYSNIASISGVPKALKATLPPPVHKNILFDIDAPDMSIFNGFYDKLKAAISAAPEWTGKKTQAQSEGHASQSILDDDIPF